jgi:hypothetical protein
LLQRCDRLDHLGSNLVALHQHDRKERLAEQAHAKPGSLCLDHDGGNRTRARFLPCHAKCLSRHRSADTSRPTAYRAPGMALEPEQEELLVSLVEAWRSIPRAERHEFVLVRTNGPDIIIGPPGQLAGTYYVDALTLVDAGFLNRIPSKSDLHFIITARGFQFYEELKQGTGEPTRQVEAEMIKYLNGEDFQKRYPAAYEGWSEAHRLLWGADSDKQLTTIGLKLREAARDFAGGLVGHHQPPDVDPNAANTVERLRSVVAMRHDHLGEKREAFLDALIHYWGTVSDLLQRQVHGAHKAGEPLTWEDARRCVFKTLVVMLEVERAL